MHRMTSATDDAHRAGVRTLDARRAWAPVRQRPRIAALALADGGDSADTGSSLTQDEVLARLGLAGDEFAEGIFAGSRSGFTVESMRSKVGESIWEFQS